MRRKKIQGFSLIETVIAITVIAVVLAGSARLLFTLTNATADNQDRVAATYLAQECLELTRNLRDTAWKQNLPWDCPFGTSDYSIEVLDFCAELRTEREKISAEKFRIGDDTRTTEFRRMLTSEVRTFDLEEKATEILFHCQISWQGQTGERKLETSHILTNWRQR